MNKEKTRNVVAWVLQVLMGLEFILAGQAKFTNKQLWAEHFQGWGFPGGTYMVIGGIEVIAALFIFFPKYAARAALVLGGVMLGAVLTHLVHGEWDRIIVTVILLALLSIVYYLRK